MLQRVLTYCVLIAVALQSTIAIAMVDTHQSHQSGVEHIVLDEAHQHLAEPEAFHSQSVDTESSSHQLDCHHCNHCHGHFSPALFIQHLDILLPKYSSTIPDYSESIFPETFEAFLRPPRA